MKKVYYDEGPLVIKVGPKGEAVKMFFGEPREFDDETAAKLLAKPMFKEWQEKQEGRKKPVSAVKTIETAGTAETAETVINSVEEV